MTASDRGRISQEIADEILGYGPLEPLLRDPEVTEIMVNGHDLIYVERAGRITTVPTGFADEAHLRRTIDKIVGRVGRRVDESSPMVDARLADGSRVNAVIPPIALDGSMLTIRKFAADPFNHQDLIGFGTMTKATSDFLHACVQGRLNVHRSGGTGAGRRHAHVLSSFIPPEGADRHHRGRGRAAAAPGARHAAWSPAPTNIEGKGEIRSATWCATPYACGPDRIVVGEVRDASALDMLQAMNTGHDGSICTVHSNSPRDTLSRIETMVLMAGVDLPMRAIREQIASAATSWFQQSRLSDGSRRITHITEVERMEG
jgi:pilus assembly protein CpaF